MPTARHIEEARRIVADGLPIGPRMHPCVCGAGRHAHKGADRTGSCKATECKRYRAKLSWQLAYDAIDAQALDLGQALRRADKIERDAHYKANPRKPGEWSIGASDTGTCSRALYYRNLPPDDLIRAWEDKREAMAGTMLHDEITRRMQLVYPWRSFKEKVRIPGLDRDSELDAYDPITCELEDYKTAGEWKWARIGDDGPADETWGQTLLYGLAMEELGYPVKTLRLSYYRRANGHDDTFVRDYDRAEAEAWRDKLLGKAQALDMLAAEGNPSEEMIEALLPRDGDGPARDPLCKRCPFRLHCWNIPAAQAVGRSGYSYTVLGPDPAEEAIIWSVEKLVDARAAKKKAEEQEAEAKDLLDGVPAGRYGDYEGYEQAGALNDDTGTYIERIKSNYTKPDGERPPLDEITMPKRRNRSSFRWGKVRKATLQREAKERKAAGVIEAAEAAAPPLRDADTAHDAGTEVA